MLPTHQFFHRAAAWATLVSFIVTPLGNAWANSRTPAARASSAHKSAARVAEAAEETSDTNPADSSGETSLAPGFLVSLSSSSDAKLNGAFRIQADGRVSLPYSITLSTNGLTLGQFRSQLAKSYAGYFRGAADVHARIKQKRYWVEVLGMVARPGDYLVKQDSPLDEIISQAGGLTDDLANGYVRIVQTIPSAHSNKALPGKTSWIDLSEYYRGRATEVPKWIGADRIFFQKERPDFAADQYDAEATRKIQVLGEVRSPGELTFRPNADAYYYLIKTGGPTSQSDLDKIEVVRADKATGERKPISFGAVADVRQLQGGDIMIFHPVRTSTLEKTLSITAIITSIVTASLLTYIAVKQANR